MKKTAILVGAVMLASVLNVAAATAKPGQEVCPDGGDWIKTDLADDAGDTVTIKVDVGWRLLTEICVKAGQDVYYEMISDEGVLETTFTTPNGKDVSHYSYRFFDVPDEPEPTPTPDPTPDPTPTPEPTPTPTPEPTPSCEEDGSCDDGDIVDLCEDPNEFFDYGEGVCLAPPQVLEKPDPTPEPVEVEELPRTGPAETLVLLLGGLSFMVGGYGLLRRSTWT